MEKVERDAQLPTQFHDRLAVRTKRHDAHLGVGEHLVELADLPLDRLLKALDAGIAHERGILEARAVNRFLAENPEFLSFS